jgi:hypothetical protein
MKKNLFGLLAVVFALVFSAFTVRDSIAVFVFQGPNYSALNVADPEKWIRTEAGACTSHVDVLACTVRIDKEMLEEPEADNLAEALPGVQLDINTSGSNQYYVEHVRFNNTNIEQDINNKPLE